MLSEAIKERLAQLTSLVFLLLLWSALSVYAGGIIPSPSRSFAQLWVILSSGRFAEPLFATLPRLLGGFGFALILGLIVGIATGRVPLLRDLSSGVLTVLMTIPSIVVIFGGIMIFGIRYETVVLTTGLIVFSFIAVPVRERMQALDEDLLKMADAFKASTMQRVRDIYIPYLIPPLLSSSRIAFALSWKMVLLAEIFAFSPGLGWRINLSYLNYDLATLLAWVVMFIALVLLTEQVIRGIERLVVRW